MSAATRQRWQYTIGRSGKRSRVAHAMSHRNQPICGVEVAHEVPGGGVAPSSRDWCKKCLAEAIKQAEEA